MVLFSVGDLAQQFDVFIPLVAYASNLDLTFLSVAFLLDFQPVSVWQVVGAQVNQPL